MFSCGNKAGSATSPSRTKNDALNGQTARTLSPYGSWQRWYRRWYRSPSASLPVTRVLHFSAFHCTSKTAQAYLPTVPYSAGLSRKTYFCPAIPQQSNSVPHFNNVPLAVKITHVRRKSKAIYVWETRFWKRNGVVTRCVA